MDCKHICPRCKRAWEHTFCGAHVRAGKARECSECDGSDWLYSGEHFVDEFKKWAREARKRRKRMDEKAKCPDCACRCGCHPICDEIGSKCCTCTCSREELLSDSEEEDGREG